MVIIDWVEAFFGSNTFNNAIMPLVIAIVVSGILALLVNYVVEKQKYEQDKILGKESFIREITSKEKESLLNGWIKLILDKEALTKPSQKQLTRQFEDLFLKTTMYGGERLISLITLFQIHNYKTGDIPAELKTEKQTYKSLMYLAFISCEMKKEFTDVYVSPLTLIQLKFTDYNKKEDILLEVKEEIEKEIKEHKKERNVENDITEKGIFKNKFKRNKS